MGNGTIASTPEDQRARSLVSEVEKRGLFERYVQSPVEVRLVHGGGSDRGFYRVRGQNGSVILMISSGDDGDFVNYVEIARFLEEIGVGVPAIYEANPDEHFLFMEDVGDESLYNKAEGVASPEAIISWYEMVLGVLVHMQVEGGKKWPHFPALPRRSFDYHALRWETDYFQKYFLEADCGIEIGGRKELAREFGILAETVSREPLHFMHRDFQSQNIMIHNGAPRILDFQGGRRGLLHYDLVSLLKDAYVVLPEDAREHLLTVYLEELSEKGIEVEDYEHFYEVFVLTGLQRNMQALGAFSYLSLIKSKGWFRQYIPAGVAYLQEALKGRGDFPVLSETLEKIMPLH